MSDGIFDGMRAMGIYPRKGYGFQTEEQQKAEVQRLLNNGDDRPWVLKEAARFGIPATSKTHNDEAEARR